MCESERDDRFGIADSSSDERLIERLRRGEQDAATKLYFRYAKRLHSLASAQTSPQYKSRFDPEDIVQSVFRTFFRRVNNGLYDVPPGDEIWHLLLVLALNKIRKLARHHQALKRDVRKTHGSDRLDPAGEHLSGGDEDALRVLKLVLAELLEALPDTQRTIVELRINGCGAEEISLHVQRSKRTVERTLQQFRHRLSCLIDAPPAN